MGRGKTAFTPARRPLTYLLALVAVGGTLLTLSTPTLGGLIKGPYEFDGKRMGFKVLYPMDTIIRKFDKPVKFGDAKLLVEFLLPIRYAGPSLSRVQVWWLPEVDPDQPFLHSYRGKVVDVQVEKMSPRNLPKGAAFGYSYIGNDPEGPLQVRVEDLYFDGGKEGYWVLSYLAPSHRFSEAKKLFRVMYRSFKLTVND